MSTPQTPWEAKPPEADGRRWGWGPRRPKLDGTAEVGVGAPTGAAKPPITPRRRWQRRLFAALGVVWLVIGFVEGFVVGRWVLASLWFGVAAVEGALWLMAGRR